MQFLEKKWHKIVSKKENLFKLVYFNWSAYRPLNKIMLSLVFFYDKIYKHDDPIKQDSARFSLPWDLACILWCWRSSFCIVSSISV